MKRFLSAIVLMVLLALGTFASLALGDDGGDGANDSKVTICHKVEGEGNTGSGYSVIDVSKDSIVNGNGQLDPNGHGTHPGDIIPAFDAGSGPGNKTWGAFAGQGDAALISSNCAPPAGSTTTPPTESTTTPVETTTTTESTTTTDAVTTTTETTPAPPVTTDSQTTDPLTTTVNATTTTAAPPSHTETADTKTDTSPASPEPESKPNTDAGSPHNGVKAGSAKHKAHAPKRMAGLLAAATAPRQAPFTR